MLVAVAAAWLITSLAADRPVVLTPVDHEGLMAEVARHRGKVVVLDCWSTSCPPCVKEFPQLIRLAARHPRAVVCLSLSLDYDGLGTPAEVLPTVRGFLEQAGAQGVINLVATEEADVMYRRLDLVGVPTVLIWRADGRLAVKYDENHALQTLGRPFTYDDVESTVEDLLARADH